MTERKEIELRRIFSKFIIKDPMVDDKPLVHIGGVPFILIEDFDGLITELIFFSDRIKK